MTRSKYCWSCEVQLNEEMQLGKSVVMQFVGRESLSPWPGSLPVKLACFRSVMNALIALSLVLFSWVMRN